MGETGSLLWAAIFLHVSSWLSSSETAAVSGSVASKPLTEAPSRVFVALRWIFCYGWRCECSEASVLPERRFPCPQSRPLVAMVDRTELMLAACADSKLEIWRLTETSFVA